MKKDHCSHCFRYLGKLARAFGYVLVAALLILPQTTLLSCSSKPVKKKTPDRIKIHRLREVSSTEMSSGPLNILLLGSDSRTESTTGLSDAIILVHINPKDKSAFLISFPRDSRVPVPGHKTDKINSAMFLGGPALTAKTIEDLTGIKIQYFAVTTFKGFTRMINNLGGVQITLEKSIRDRFAGANLGAGPQKLAGDQALAFCRSRHIPDGDFARAGHQQDLALAVFEQERPRMQPQDLFRLLNIFINDCETNLSYKEAFQLAMLISKVNPDKIKRVVLPGKVANIGGGSYVLLDENELKRIFAGIKNP